MTWHFKNKGKNEEGHNPYMRAGVLVEKCYDENGNRYDIMDEGSFDHVGTYPDEMYADCPFCDSMIIFKNKRYRCIDCEYIFSKKELENLLGKEVDHFLEDEFFEYDPDFDWREHWTLLPTLTKNGMRRRKI